MLHGPFPRSPAAYTHRAEAYSDDILAGFGVPVGTNSKTSVLTVGVVRQRITLGRYPIITLAQGSFSRDRVLKPDELGAVYRVVE